MKKAIALLLAFLCLAAIPALGESCYITFRADEGEMVACLSAFGLEHVDTLAPGIAKLLNSMTLETCTAASETGDQMAKMTLLIGGETLLDSTTRIPADKSCMLWASSMIPGYAVRIPAPQGELRSYSFDMKQADAAALEELIAGPVTEKFTRWMDSLNSTTGYGDFMGDAYDSGRVCVDLTLEDSDLYVLSMYLEEEIAGACGLMGMPGAEKDFLKSMLDAALKNENQYKVRLVYDGASELTGFSVTMLNNGVQVATLSLGFETPGMTRFVLGTGIQDEVYYLDGELRTGDKTDLVLRAYGDPRKAGFPGAKAEARNLLATLTLEIKTSGTENTREVTYSGSVETRNGLKLRELGSFSGAGKEYAWEDSTFLGDHEQAVLTVSVRTEDADTTPPWPDDLEILDDMTDERIHSAIKETAASLSATLIRVVPTELLMYIVQLTNTMGD